MPEICKLEILLAIRPAKICMYLRGSESGARKRMEPVRKWWVALKDNETVVNMRAVHIKYFISCEIHLRIFIWFCIIERHTMTMPMISRNVWRPVCIKKWINVPENSGSDCVYYVKYILLKNCVSKKCDTWKDNIRLHNTRRWTSSNHLCRNINHVGGVLWNISVWLHVCKIVYFSTLHSNWKCHQ